jgi:hypothetical protein
MLAPGLPVPGATSAGATSCGAKRPRVCADASAGAAQIKAAVATAQHQTLVGPHPTMPAFFDSNRGNFKPGCGASYLHYISYCALAAFTARSIMGDAGSRLRAASRWRLYSGVQRLTMT